MIYRIFFSNGMLCFIRASSIDQAERAATLLYRQKVQSWDHGTPRDALLSIPDAHHILQGCKC